MVDGYNSGNLSDIIKHSNLECIVDNLDSGFRYIEMHSGGGLYTTENGKKYEGSSIRVLKKCRHSVAILHEKNPETRKSLENAVLFLNDLIIREDWTAHIKEYIETACPRDFVLFDPTKITDYHEINTYLPELVKRGQNMMLYIPQSTGDTRLKEEHARIVEETKTCILDNLPMDTNYQDLKHGTIKRGIFERIEHNIVVSKINITEAARKNHNNKQRELSSIFNFRLYL